MTPFRTKLLPLLGILLLLLLPARAGNVDATYNFAASVPVTVSGNYDATGLYVTFTLNFAPATGTNLTVVKLTGFGTISGTFANLAQNQAVALSYGGQTYNYVANYFGGTGNDLVLQWANTRTLAWGSDFYGELGNGASGITSNLPVAVTATGVLAGKTITAIAAGYAHTLALCSDGTVAAWGYNGNGQIGSNGGGASNVPVLVSTLGVLTTKRVIAVTAGGYHSLALCSDGTVATWGDNGFGQLGNGGAGTTGTPVAVNTAGVLAGKKVIAIAAGKYFSVALLSTGAVVAWGDNTYGQLGNNTTTTSSVPVAVDATGIFSTTTATTIATGQSHCLALCADGTLAAWGYNADGEFGNNSIIPSKVPTAVTVAGTALSGKTVSAIASGGFHNLALCSDGTVAAWGRNTYGQLGTTSGSHLLAAPVATAGTPLSGKTITAISGGYGHSLAICSDGTLASWGENPNGELGTGNNTPSTVPVAVSTTPLSAGERFQLPATGPNAMHCLAVTASSAPLSQLTTGTLISNGSFENGFANWSVSDINNPYIALAPSVNGVNPGYGIFTSSATDGTHSATSGFDGDGPGIVRLAHDVAVTAAEPFVRFDYRAGWDMLTFYGSTQARTFSVTIEPSGGGTALQSTVLLTAPAHTKNLDTGTLSAAVDLSAYIGTTVRVCFDLLVPESKTGPALFQLDNVRTAALLPATVNPITRAATDITLSGATLSGIVNANGSSITAEYEYGTGTNYDGVITDAQSPFTGSTNAASSATITGLIANTTYHYRVKTTDGAVTKYGTDATFTTLPHAPIISDFGNSFLTNSSATFYATVDPNGGSTVVSFEYGTTAAYGSSTPAWENPLTVVGGAHGQISGLAGGVTLHWRVKAQNAGGISYSADATYTPDPASPGDPIVNTLAPTMVSRNSATLNGTVKAGVSSAVATSAFPSHAYLLPVMRNVTTGGSETLGLMFTGDDFATVTDFVSGDLAAAPGQGLRDPALFRAGGKWYCACTLDAWGAYPNQNKFRILVSDNLVNWTTLTDVTVDGATQYTWAPKWFYDAPTNRVYVTLSSDRSPGVGAHDPKLAYASLNDLTTWSTWTTVSSLLPTASDVFWDFQLSTDGVYYYAVGVNGGNPGSMKIYRSNTIDSGYTLFSNFDFGGGVFAEQGFLEWMGGTKWAIYYCKTALFKSCRRISTDGMATWGAETVVNDYSTSGKSFACPCHLTPDMLGWFASTSGNSASVGFQFGTTTNYTSTMSASPETVSSTSATAIAASRAALSPGTTYHYRAFAFASGFYVYGPDVTFATPAIGFPAASTEAATNITRTTALLHGYASANNGPVTTVSFEYGLDTNYGSVVTLGGSNTVPNFVPVATQIPVSGDGVTYHYRVKAKNNIGTTYGQDMTFVTPDSHEARLYGLNFDSGTLWPAFDRSIISYAMGLPFETTSLSLTPTASTGIASVMVNGVLVSSGGISLPIALNVGTNVLTITVTALDGVTQQTYTVTVTRAVPMAGSLDLSFGGTGTVVTNVGANDDIPSTVIVQPDGKILVAGLGHNGNSEDFALARYNPDGSPDTTFGSAGRLLIDIADSADAGSCMALQPDGKILVAGGYYNATNLIFAVVRCNANGTLDTTFNGTGKAFAQPGASDAFPASVAVQGDGKIIVAGNASNGTDNDFALVRFHGDLSTGAPGTLDTTFGSAGKVITDFGGTDDLVGSMALQGDGKIVVAGSSNTAGKLDFALARYNADGTPDTDFNTTGKLTTRISTNGDDGATGVLVQPNGRILAGGYSYAGNGTHDFALVRYNSNGLLDTDFNATGIVTTDFNANDDQIRGIALQGDGKIVAAGYTIKAGVADLAISRYTSGGILDTTFHGTGTTTTNPGYGSAYGTGMTIQDDGKIVVAGFVTGGFWDDFVVARFLGDGPAIAVQQAQGTNIFDGISTMDFGGMLPGSSASVTFTIQNTGTADLTGLASTFDGTDSGNFTVTASPGALASPWATTAFTVRFTPTSTGAKSAALHIASNVTGNTQSYDIALTGTGLTPAENWRQQFFGTFANADAAADTADPNGNGISNLLEYAFGGDPLGGTTGVGILPQTGIGDGNVLQITFTRSLDRTDLTLTVLAADSLLGPWTALAQSTAGGSFVLLAPGATVLEAATGNTRGVTVTDLYSTNDPDHPQRFIKLEVVR